MQWGAPHFLHLLWAAPVLVLLLYGLMRRREQRLREIMDEQVLNTLLPPSRRKRRAWQLALWLIALTLCVLALARPQWGEKWIEVRHMGLDIIVVIDTSNSMRAEDIRPNRLERAKFGVRDLVGRLRGDRIGLIPFAGDSYLYCPLTADYGAFLMMLDDIHPGIVQRGGTAIEQALRKAVQSFADHVLADRVIVLITDGEDYEGNPLTVIDEMRQRNIRLFAVGVGSPEGDLIPMTDEQGRITFLRDREGNIVRTALQEEVLERLATRTGGMYVRATPGDFGLERIYEQGIAPLQRDMLETEMIRAHEDRFAWFLGAALLLLIVEAVMTDGTRRNGSRIPKPIYVLLLLAIPFPANADAPRSAMREGLRDYREERFQEAAESFREAAEQAADAQLDPARALHNRANALYRQGRYEEAAATYQEALRSTDLDVQQSAHFNRGNALLTLAHTLAEEQELDTAKAMTERALDSYRNALLLQPGDRDAKINYELADRFREELEMRLAQQPPSPEPQPGDDPEQEAPDDAPPPPAPDDEPEEEPEPDAPHPDDTGPPPTEAVPDQITPDTMEEMTPEEAMLLLEAMRDEEQETRDQMRLRLGDPAEVEKDW